MESILEAIGNTPLVRVRRCAPSSSIVTFGLSELGKTQVKIA
jgi:hypothetical protein